MRPSSSETGHHPSRVRLLPKSSLAKPESAGILLCVSCGLILAVELSESRSPDILVILTAVSHIPLLGVVRHLYQARL